MEKSNLTTKDTKSTKFGVIIFRTLRVLRELLRGENSCPFGCGSAALSPLPLTIRFRIYLLVAALPRYDLRGQPYP